MVKLLMGQSFVFSNKYKLRKTIQKTIKLIYLDYGY
jgi:hypothetical protein